MRWKHLAWRVGCPRCGAEPWKPCSKNNGDVRRAFHIERHESTRDAKVAPKAPRGPSKGYGEDWAALRAKVFAAKGSQCAYCGADASHVDHRTPKGRGGSDQMENLEPCCRRCNMAKGMLTVEEWRS